MLAVVGRLLLEASAAPAAHDLLDAAEAAVKAAVKAAAMAAVAAAAL
jgi:hypothetical protein